MVGIESFTTRMIDLDFNKKMFTYLEASPAEYLLIDLMNISFPLYRVVFLDRQSYVQNAFASKVFPKLREIDNMSTFTYEEIDIADLPDDRIKNGLKILSEWALKHYSKDKIIVNIPHRAKKWISSDNILHDYPTQKCNNNGHLFDAYSEEYDYIIKYYSDFLINCLNGCIVYECAHELTAYDMEFSKTSPPPTMHYSPNDYVNQGFEFLEMLGIKSKGLININNILLPLNAKLVENNNNINIYRDNFYGVVLNINMYMRFLLEIYSLYDLIIVLSVREDAGVYWQNFDEKIRERLGLTCSPNIKESYAAIIDYNSKTILEKSSEDVSSLLWEEDDHSIRVLSVGYTAVLKGKEAKASICVDRKEVSNNKRGINIVIIHRKSFKILDSVYVDLNRNKEMVVQNKKNNINLIQDYLLRN